MESIKEYVINSMLFSEGKIADLPWINPNATVLAATTDATITVPMTLIDSWGDDVEGNAEGTGDEAGDQVHECATMVPISWTEMQQVKLSIEKLRRSTSSENRIPTWDIGGWAFVMAPHRAIHPSNGPGHDGRMGRRGREFPGQRPTHVDPNGLGPLRGSRVPKSKLFSCFGYKSRERYGIKDLGEAAKSASRWEVESRRRLCPWQKDEHLVGVEDDVKKLLKESILCEEKKGLSIAVLEGMGGIGKSTLAREIYNHPHVVAAPFDCRGWVVVSSEFTPQETIKQLILELPGSDKQKVRELEESTKDKLYLLQKLKEMLHKQLEGKSYFIVLDDVWEKEHLESLITAFPNQQDKASRLLVTTRNKIITKYDQYVHNMSLLDSKKSWELLLKKAFVGSTIGKCPEEFESVGTEILQKCDGLPLAISVVGGLLRQTQTKNGWEQVLTQLNSYLGRTESDVSTILELSYQNLSPQLKSCFLCLAFFKEDFTIRTKRLVKLWDAQGLIQQEGSRSIDEIGRGYLNELINRSMVQIQDLHVNDQVKSCHIHDLVRDVCLRKAKEEIGLEIVKGKGGISSESSYKPRHRVVYAKNLETSSSNQNKHVRSLFLLSVHDYYSYITTPSDYWKGYQLLKTVELDATAFKRFPNSFRLLIGLKCLRIYSYHGGFVELPCWFDHLRNLEVVDMKSCFVFFPRLVSLKMDKLRYFISAAIRRGPTNKNMWNKNIECLRE
ncbi:putative disease resistance RPP13-like protein 3 [Salvia miltiorrhiza]|uniref:putative disease resistance RPP13-like protein 3 n=1 Tax=Salvia miltiorrhiza TaxID=226208 RepID=UPI0025AC4D12|nr:putative disease resistance RPP13-like protein 3 [Salvia miltiorrhiza]